MAKRLLRFSFIFLIIVIMLVIAFFIYIRPSQTLDLKYSDIPWKDKLLNMIQQGAPEMQLTEEEINQLIKRTLSDDSANAESTVRVTGVNTHLNRDLLDIDINASWGPFDIGAEGHYKMSFDNGELTLAPLSLSVRQLSFPPETFGLAKVRLQLDSFLPDVVRVNRIEFHDDSINLGFKLDLPGLARYLQTLR